MIALSPTITLTLGLHIFVQPVLNGHIATYKGRLSKIRSSMLHCVLENGTEKTIRPSSVLIACETDEERDEILARSAQCYGELCAINDLRHFRMHELGKSCKSHLKQHIESRIMKIIRDTTERPDVDEQTYSRRAAHIDLLNKEIYTNHAETVDWLKKSTARSAPPTVCNKEGVPQ